ncbi:something about silencing protein 10 [Dromiciops gliroides]|uniref:something about silencing protein 10 n=1 Tax=Dromiciops gliroides TaxID=33562 RepID=UPI001CC5141F|nr:something about silencing protein 10 [Dromiciops gliroides]
MVGKARKRGAGLRRAARAQVAEEEEEEPGPPPSPGDPSYYQDQVDAFHEARSQAALAPSWSDGESGAEDPEEEEEVLGLDVPDEEDEEGDGGSVGGSSVCSEAEDPDADPSLSWGQRKQLYYDTDYGASKGRGRQSQQQEEEEEREEEREARLIQRRLAQALAEDDVGLSWVQAFGPEAGPPPAEAPTRVAQDLGRLPAQEQLRLLRREAPELLELLGDLKAKLREARDEPGPGQPAGRRLRAKHRLCLLYCAHVSFYLVLKARRAPVRGHPVIERLLAYRRLLGALERPGPGRRRPPEPRSGREARERLEAKRKAPHEDEDEDEDAEPGAKRAISYQMAKNKGLTPRRKKIDRNPRVKHREKFRRAKIRRRGQVPAPLTEERKYCGEPSGIRAGVKKSIRLK